MRIAVAALAAAVVLLVPAAASGSAKSSWHAPFLGVVPHAGTLRALGSTSAMNPSGPLDLQTQPCNIQNLCWVMRTNRIYAIYWIPTGSTCDAISCSAYESGINEYFTDVAAASGRTDNVYSVATQYYDATGPISYSSTFGGSYVDTTSPFPNDCSDGVDAICNSDAAVEKEIDHAISVKGWQPGLNTMFFVMTPDGIGSCFYPGNTHVINQACTTTNNGYCAYHSAYADANDDIVIYGNEPFNGTITGCFGNPGQNSPNNADVDPTLNTISHEQNEAITDPADDAWLDAAGFEMADICAWMFGPNQVINGHSYSLQQEWSNDGNACLDHYLGVPVNFGAPVVSGAAGEGQLLSTTHGTWSQAPTTYAEQWQRCAANGSACADITGAKSATYQLTGADVGHAVRVEVSAHNAAGTSAFVPSAPTVAILPLPAPTVSPVISGIAAVQKRLSTTAGTWNTAVTLAYAWLRCASDGTGCAVIPGATTTTYAAVAADAGHTLRARVSATNVAGTTAGLSNLSGLVVGAPAATKSPHVSGRAKVGRKLSGSRGAWTYAPTSYRYQWLRCNAHGGSCSSIRHATHPRYSLSKRDAGHRLRLRITAINIAGRGTATSAATARVPAARKH